jgi:hypothetical protein
MKPVWDKFQNPARNTGLFRILAIASVMAQSGT